MKKTFGMLIMGMLAGITVFAQDTTNKLNKRDRGPYDTLSKRSTDTTAINRNSNWNKMPKDKKRRAWPDTLPKPDSLRKE